MPRVHFVKKAQKDNPVVKKGESYYWWQFRFGGKKFSRTRPRPSQLTQSEFLGTAYELIERLEDLKPNDFEDVTELIDTIDEIISEARDLAEETESRRYNMPDHLQDGDIGCMLEERAEAMNSWADELETTYQPWEDTYADSEDEEQKKHCMEEFVSEIQSVTPEV